MKAGSAFGCLFWALLYCVLYLDLVNASEDELMDFDFMAAKANEAPAQRDDWALDSDEQQQSEQKLQHNMLDFSVDLDEPEPAKQLPPFDWRERILRSALAKAFRDSDVRQKFVEVMPILRVLSSQQRLALSALISAQMNARQGQELKLQQVRMMFGDDKKLLLPIVYDLANLVKNSARKYIRLEDLTVAALQKRQDDLTAEESVQDDSVGTIDVSGKSPVQQPAELEDFFDEMQAELLDPQMINEALQLATPTATSSKRKRRAANEFVHKLPRSVPLSVTEQQLLGGVAGRTIKLNTTAFQQPNDTPMTTVGPGATQSYEQIEDLAFAGLNGTELPLANADERVAESGSGEEPLPSPEELIAGPRYRLNNNQNHHQRLSAKMPPIKRKRTQSGGYGRGRPKPAASSHNPVVTTHKKCERFTNNMCIRTDDYPLEQIMGSIRRHKNAMSALLAEFYDRPNNNLEFGEDFDDYALNKKRREDEGSAGGMCQSVVRYARPQKAKAASGEWKFIVNTGQHTQTLRLEKCSNAGESCSYLAQSYRSHCSQVYNYHRLLSWDKIRGLHVDIFKVPTCCSCQVDGYRQQFPPLSSIQSKDYTPANYKLPDNGNANGYSTINDEDLDYNDESDEDDLGLSYAPYSNRDTNELSYLGSKKVRAKLPAPSSVGPYLSPPDDEDAFGSSSSYKPHKSSVGSGANKKYYNQLSRRRPQHNEPRVDLDMDLSPSETQAEQEVNVFGQPLAGEQQRVPLKRKRIYTSTHTQTAANSPAAAATLSGAAAPGRLRIPIAISQPQTTAATSSSSSSSSLPARTGAAAAVGVGLSVATNAHEASVASAAAAAPNAAIGQRYYAGGGGGSKSRPRFYAPAATSTAASHAAGSAATPLPTAYYKQQQQQQQQSPQSQSTSLPQPSYVNSIYDSNSNNNSSGNRRINYSYHPIIDFFEQKPSKQSNYDAAQSESRLVEKRIIAPTVAAAASAAAHPTPHERRIGFGAGAGRYGYGFASDNAWQPLVVDS
ncbi:NT1 [Drosophila busckii]|uniref:NT1 n=1 Tax=Drosophila busckii TaxID=30019 RepID=A0A0M5IYE7_DROBS|nr:neurotrophin 1 [Drosophila busckii]ALC43361.1 NT1 [Drosophila busckii]